MPTLGVQCSAQRIFLALAEGGALIADRDHEILETAAAFEATERLVELLADVERLVAEVEATTVQVLLPEQTYEDSYTRIAPRATHEAVVRLGAARAGAEVELLHRATARSRLGLARRGRFDDQVDQRIPEPVGRYWKAGRRLAAAAALAAREQS